MIIQDNSQIETVRRQMIHGQSVYKGIKDVTLQKYCEAFSKVAGVLSDEEFDAFIRFHTAEGALLTISAVLGLL